MSAALMASLTRPVRDCRAIGPKAVDMVNMLLPNCNILYLQGKNFTGH